MRSPSKLLFSTLVLTACASAPPRKQVSLDFQPPVEQQAPARIDSAWWRAFDDDGLNQILSEALSRNGDLAVAAANISAAAAQAKIAGAPLFPQLSGSLAGSKDKRNFIGFPIPGSSGNVLSTTTVSYGLSLNLSWELDLWGRLSAEKAAAVAQMQAAQADYVGARLSLAAQVCKVWFAATESKRQLQLAQATVENWSLAQERVVQRYQSGLTTSLDVRLSQSNLARAQADLSARKFQYERTLRQLETLLWRYPAAEMAPRNDLPVITTEIPEGLSANLLNRRPDVAAAERRLAAAGASVSGAKRALLPQIRLTGSSGTSSNALSDLLNGDFSVWSIAGNLLQPIFQGGKLRANVALTQSREAMAMMQYQSTALQAFAEVENALSSQSHLQEQERALQVAAEQALAARQLAETQYSSGLIDFITMLETQRAAFDTERQLLNAKLQRLQARIDLYLALGGGFEVENDKKAL